MRYKTVQVLKDEDFKWSTTETCLLAVFRYQGINKGPVRMVSTNAVNIITSERAYRSANLMDFNEMMGFPANQLTTEYWFPLIDSTSFMQTCLTIGNAR